MAFESLAALRLKTHKNKVSFSQYKDLRCYINHPDRYIGGVNVDQVKPTGINILLNALTGQNPNIDRPALRQILVDARSTTNCTFEYGVDLELITRSPTRGREVSRYTSRRYRRALTATEQDLIVSTPHQARMDALVMMLTGLRRGELIPFTWDDIDPNVLKISIAKNTESRNSNRSIVKSGIEASWGRVVSTTLDLTLELQKAKTVTRSKYVCPHADGGTYTLMSW